MQSKVHPRDCVWRDAQVRPIAWIEASRAHEDALAAHRNLRDAEVPVGTRARAYVRTPHEHACIRDADPTLIDHSSGDRPGFNARHIQLVLRSHKAHVRHERVFLEMGMKARASRFEACFSEERIAVEITPIWPISQPDNVASSWSRPGPDSSSLNRKSARSRCRGIRPPARARRGGGPRGHGHNGRGHSEGLAQPRAPRATIPHPPARAERPSNR